MLMCWATAGELILSEKRCKRTPLVEHESRGVLEAREIEEVGGVHSWGRGWNEIQYWKM